MRTEVKKTTCRECGVTEDMAFIFGADARYPDDFELNCTRCDNWECGTLKNLSNFKIERQELEL